jgi:hypothetical protein
VEYCAGMVGAAIADAILSMVGINLAGWVGLPNRRVHRRVLAELDRPAALGDTDSLRMELSGLWVQRHDPVHHAGRG